MGLFSHQVPACWAGLRTEYLPMLRQALTKPLVELEKEGIQPVVSLMQASLCHGFLSCFLGFLLHASPVGSCAC